jgi:AcrR family transcriptional regulator
MPKIRQSPKQPAEKRRRQLLTAAQKLFARKGYRGTTIDEIAHKAGLTKGAFYYHFHGKQDVLMELVNEVGREYHDSFHRLIERGNLSPVDLLDALVNVHASRDLAEFLNMIDLWLQAQRSTRVKNLLDKHFSEDVENAVTRMDRVYGQSDEERRQITMFTFCFYSGLASLKCLKYSHLDIETQKRLFGRLSETLKQKSTKH